MFTNRGVPLFIPLKEKIQNANNLCSRVLLGQSI
ncbi:hypothetical protein [Caloramator sp. Dgby_cultured_2]